MSESCIPVEVTTRYATSVDDLSQAWAFVMARVDQVGPSPSITINPVWTVHADGVDYENPPRRFEVVVSDMVEEAE